MEFKECAQHGHVAIPHSDEPHWCSCECGTKTYSCGRGAVMHGGLKDFFGIVGAASTVLSTLIGGVYVCAEVIGMPRGPAFLVGTLGSICLIGVLAVPTQSSRQSSAARIVLDRGTSQLAPTLDDAP